MHEAGDVTIYWQSLDLSAIEFQIFDSTAQGNWTLAGTDYTQVTSHSFHHTSARADTTLYYYQIKAVYPTGDIVESDIFSTIFLFVDNSTAGRASLFWDHVHLPLPEGSSNYYKIYKSVYELGIPGTWNLIADDVENTRYNWVVEDGLCDDSINFKIEIENSYGCSSVSNIAGDKFSEDIQPEKPVFDSVSIINNSEVILGWEASISSDVKGTIIYRWETNWKIIDTVFGNNITYYIDTSYMPCNDNYLYAIAAMDSCGIASPKTEATAQRPIFLYNIKYNLCSETNSLTWEHYINASLPFDIYEIWSSKNNGAIKLIDEVPSNQNNYDHTNVDNATEYSYFVRAVFGALHFTSTSCTKSITTGNFIKPDSLYLANANVLPDNNIVLTIDVDLQPNTCTWEIFRSDAGGGSQVLLTTLSRDEVTTSPYTYLDETADGSTGYYDYTIKVLDSCGAIAVQSDMMKTIFLEGEQLSNDENHLKWNAMEGFDGGVDKYYIFRMLDEVMPTLPIDSTDAQTTKYSDDISSVSAGESIFSYWVQAVEGSQNNYGYQEKSNSNIINLFREINFYFPNAFRPTGTNSVFKPVATGFGGSNYLFQIFNRWGQLIFESTDPELGWDGKHRGNPSPQGTYVYKLVYQNVFNITKQQQGIVTLID